MIRRHQTQATDCDSHASPCFATAIRKASRRLSQLYDDALAREGLRSTQFAILGHLSQWPQGTPTLAQLAKALVMDRSALGHNLRPLERDGLVSLEAGEKDRRQRRIVLTAKGRTKLRAALKQWDKAQARFSEVLGDAQAESLRLALLEIAHNERLSSLSD